MRCIGMIDSGAGEYKIRPYALVIDDSWLLNDASQRPVVIRGRARLAGYWARLAGGLGPGRLNRGLH